MPGRKNNYIIHLFFENRIVKTLSRADLLFRDAAQNDVLLAEKVLLLKKRACTGCAMFPFAGYLQGGSSQGQCHPNFFCALPPNFVVSRIFFIEAYNKSKNLAPLKMFFAPLTLRPGYGPGYLQI